MWIRRFSRFFGCYCVTSVTLFRDRGHTITVKKTTKSIIIKITPPSFLRTSLKNFSKKLVESMYQQVCLVHWNFHCTALHLHYLHYIFFTEFAHFWATKKLSTSGLESGSSCSNSCSIPSKNSTKSTWKFGKLSSPCKVSCRFSLSAYNIFKCVSKESSEVLRAVLESTARKIDQSHCAY